MDFCPRNRSAVWSSKDTLVAEILKGGRTFPRLCSWPFNNTASTARQQGDAALEHPLGLPIPSAQTMNELGRDTDVGTQKTILLHSRAREKKMEFKPRLKRMAQKQILQGLERSYPSSKFFKLQNQQQAFCSLCFVGRRGLEVIFRICSFITEKFVRNNHYKLAISQTIIWKITLRTVRGPYGKNNNSCWVFFRCLTDKSRGVVCNSYSDVFLAQEHGC